MGLFGTKVGIANDDILAIIKDVLREAETGEKVYLISPYWKLNVNFRESIIDALNRRVQLRCLIREREVLKDEDQDFVETNRIDLRTLDHLHAKVYWSPSLAVVTSMNLHNYSDKETREIAVVIEEKGILDEVETIADSWWDKAPRYLDLKRPKATRKPTAQVHEKRSHVNRTGFCIRCGKPKTYSPSYPLCDVCFPIWAKYKDKDYIEKVCHGCGQAIQSSVAKPLCRDCYKKDSFDK